MKKIMKDKGIDANKELNTLQKERALDLQRNVHLNNRYIDGLMRFNEERKILRQMQLD